MQITVAEIIRMKPAMDKILTRQLPIKISYQMARIIKALDQELETFYEQRNKLLDQYGAKDEKGELIWITNDDGERTGIQIAEEYIQVFSTELDACSKVAVEINANPVDISDLELYMTIEDVCNLEPILVFPETQDK